MRILLASLSLFCLVAPAAAQDSNRSALRSMVATERAFSRMSEMKGIRESFTEFIAEDGILFRPTPVLGKKWMQEHPLPPAPSRPLLTWQPIFAGISRAGDMGYSTGPWQYKNDIKDAKPSAFGNFMTVWKKQPDGKWKFAIDLGTSNPEPKTAAKLSFGPTSARSPKRVSQALARTSLLDSDREFSRVSSSRGAVEALLSFAATDIRLFRNNKVPFLGRRAAATAMSPLSVEWTWTPTAGDVSISGDLGFSYGIYELREKSGKRSLIEKGNYLRVWKKVGGAWAVIIDVADPLPPETKN